MQANRLFFCLFAISIPWRIIYITLYKICIKCIVFFNLGGQVVFVNEKKKLNSLYCKHKVFEVKKNEQFKPGMCQQRKVEWTKEIVCLASKYFTSTTLSNVSPDWFWLVDATIFLSMTELFAFLFRGKIIMPKGRYTHYVAPNLVVLGGFRRILGTFWIHFINEEIMWVIYHEIRSRHLF